MTTEAVRNSGGRGFEAELFRMADILRGSMDAAEYKHVVLGLIFLRHISHSFEARREELLAHSKKRAEDRDEYQSRNIFWVPEAALWSRLSENSRTPAIGQMIDKAMKAIESENESLRGVLPGGYARPTLSSRMLGDLIDLLTNINLGAESNGSDDILGRVYEYFLGQFANAEGKRGGEFYTPACIVKLLVEMLQPFRGRIYDPCCGSGGMFVQSERFVAEHGGRIGDIAIYGQEFNNTTWRLARMNLAVRGIETEINWNNEGSFHRDEFPDLRFDFILANPPFNISDWGGDRLREDPRWQFGAPPLGNANYAWLQHIHHHLTPGGMAGVVLANGSMSSVQAGEGDIRKNMIESGVVDCMVALPSQLFHYVQIPACLWLIGRDRRGGIHRDHQDEILSIHRDRRGEILFIDAREMGRMVSRTRRELAADDIARIADTYHAWRSEQKDSAYKDQPGFCKSATLDEVRHHDHILTPGRYVGMAPTEDDGEPFADKMRRLTAELRGQQTQAAKLDKAIAANLKALGFNTNK